MNKADIYCSCNHELEYMSNCSTLLYCFAACWSPDQIPKPLTLMCYSCLAPSSRDVGQTLPERAPLESNNFLTHISKQSQLNSIRLSYIFIMASKNVTRALRTSNLRQITSTTQRRTFVSALNAASKTAKPAFVAPTAIQQKRGLKTIDFAGTKEDVYGM